MRRIVLVVALCMVVSGNSSAAVASSACQSPVEEPSLTGFYSHFSAWFTCLWHRRSVERKSRESRNEKTLVTAERPKPGQIPVPDEDLPTEGAAAEQEEGGNLPEIGPMPEPIG